MGRGGEGAGGGRREGGEGGTAKRGKLSDTMLVSGVAAAPDSLPNSVLGFAAQPCFAEARERSAEDNENGDETVFKRCLNGVSTVFSIFDKTQNHREERFGFRHRTQHAPRDGFVFSGPSQTLQKPSKDPKKTSKNAPETLRTFSSAAQTL